MLGPWFSFVTQGPGSRLQGPLWVPAVGDQGSSIIKRGPGLSLWGSRIRSVLQDEIINSNIILLHFERTNGLTM